MTLSKNAPPECADDAWSSSFRRLSLIWRTVLRSSSSEVCAPLLGHFGFPPAPLSAGCMAPLAVVPSSCRLRALNSSELGKLKEEADPVGHHSLAAQLCRPDAAPDSPGARS